MAGEGQDKDSIGNFKISMGPQEATPKTEIPLRILVLGDFAPEMAEVTDWSTASRLLNVTPGNFRWVMQQLKPSLTLDVPNRISDKPKEVTIKLEFSDVGAFRPEGIAQQVKGLSELLEIRKLVSQFGDQKITIQEFDDQLQKAGVDPEWLERFHKMLLTGTPSAPRMPAEAEPPPLPKPVSEKTEGIPANGVSALDALLAGVDVGDERETPDKRSVVDDLIGAVLQPKRGGRKPDKSVVEAIIDELDQTLSEQINEILHHNRFQQLESAWRGLRFLIDRTDFRENIKVEALAVHKDDLRDAIYHQVFMPEYNQVTDTPLSVMVADYEFTHTPEDVELLTDIAQMAASIQVPFIASVGPAFFDSETGAELADLPILRTYFKRPGYAKWNALREDENSQYIALTTPRFLLRLPYGPENVQVKGFGFVERTRSEADHLWGRGAFAVAATLVRSFAANGWCVRIIGMDGGGVVENLPVWSYHTTGQDVRIPLDVSLQGRGKEFVDSGFVVLSSRVNDDRACVLSAPTIHRPKEYITPEETEQARLHATLPYQLFATRMAHYLKQIVRDVSTGLTAEQVQRALVGKLRMIMAGSGGTLPQDAVTVEVSGSREEPDYYTVALRITPPFQILGRSVNLALGLHLHR